VDWFFTRILILHTDYLFTFVAFTVHTGYTLHLYPFTLRTGYIYCPLVATPTSLFVVHIYPTHLYGTILPTFPCYIFTYITFYLTFYVWLHLLFFGPHFGYTGYFTVSSHTITPAIAHSFIRPGTFYRRVACPWTGLYSDTYAMPGHAQLPPTTPLHTVHTHTHTPHTRAAGMPHSCRMFPPRTSMGWSLPATTTSPTHAGKQLTLSVLSVRVPHTYPAGLSSSLLEGRTLVNAATAFSACLRMPFLAFPRTAPVVRAADTILPPLEYALLPLPAVRLRLQRTAARRACRLCLFFTSLPFFFFFFRLAFTHCLCGRAVAVIVTAHMAFRVFPITGCTTTTTHTTLHVYTTLYCYIIATQWYLPQFLFLFTAVCITPGSYDDRQRLLDVPARGVRPVAYAPLIGTSRTRDATATERRAVCSGFRP